MKKLLLAAAVAISLPGHQGWAMEQVPDSVPSAVTVSAKVSESPVYEVKGSRHSWPIGSVENRYAMQHVADMLKDMGATVLRVDNDSIASKFAAVCGDKGIAVYGPAEVGATSTETVEIGEVIDLASIPTEKYWLLRSRWNKNANTLQLFPHWTWTGREGEVVPVRVYTDFTKAELFLNGKSLGIKEKDPASSDPAKRDMLVWDDVRYQPGELKVVAISRKGQRVMEKSLHTAGAPYKFLFTVNKGKMTAGGEDLAYVTIRVGDKNGYAVPTYSGEVKVNVQHEGVLVATVNADPADTHNINSDKVRLYNGVATAIVTTDPELPGNVDIMVRPTGKEKILDGSFVIPVLGKNGEIRKALDYMRIRKKDVKETRRPVILIDTRTNTRVSKD